MILAIGLFAWDWEHQHNKVEWKPRKYINCFILKRSTYLTSPPEVVFFLLPFSIDISTCVRSVIYWYTLCHETIKHPSTLSLYRSLILSFTNYIDFWNSPWLKIWSESETQEIKPISILNWNCIVSIWKMMKDNSELYVGLCFPTADVRIARKH